MRILVGYMASESAWTRFQQSQKWQALLGYPDQFDYLLVSNAQRDVPLNWSAIVVPGGEKSGLVNLCAMRNRVRLAAQDGGYEAFMLLEADFVVLRWPTKMVSTWAMPYAVYDHPNGLTFSTVPDDYATLHNQPKCWELLGPRALIPVHCIMVGYKAFAGANWDERYVGFGLNDWDFNNNMTKQYGQCETTDAVLLHRWHEDTGRAIAPENLALYESKWGPCTSRWVT